MKIAQIGTFNVNNLGDQLFPIVFSEIINEIGEESGQEINVDHYSPNVAGYKPFYTDEKQVNDLKSLIAKEYDLVFIGGGDLIRSDDWSINNIYNNFNELSFTNIVSPTDESCRNLVTLGVGIPFEFDSAFEIYVKNSFSRCLKISVRDEKCFNLLTDSGIKSEIVPDLVVAISRYFPLDEMKKNLSEFKTRHPLSIQNPYLVFQANGNVIKPNEIEQLSVMLNEISDRLGVDICLLSIGECLGDNQLSESIFKKLNRCFIINQDSVPDITLMEKVAILANSKGFIGSSLHGNIISYSYRIPHITFSCDYSRKLKGFYELTNNVMGYGSPFEMFLNIDKIISFFSKIDNVSDRDFNTHCELIYRFVKDAIKAEKDDCISRNFSSKLDILYKENQRFLLNKLHENEQLWLRVNTSEVKLKEVETHNVELWKRVNTSEVKLKEVETHNVELWERVNTSEVRIKEVEAHNAELWKRVDNAEELNRTLLLQIEELRKKMSIDNEKAASLELQNRELWDRVNLIEQELRLVRTEYESQMELNANYKRQINELNENYQNICEENKHLLSSYKYYIKSRFKKGTFQ